MNDFEVRGRVVALNDDTGDADRAAEAPTSLRVTFDGIGTGRHTHPTRAADADDRRALQLKPGTIIRNQRRVSVITSDSRRAIGKELAIPLTAADLRINIEIELDEFIEALPDVPGISHIPPGSLLRFLKSGVILQSQVPMYPCGDTGGRIAEKYADIQKLKPADFNNASYLQLPEAGACVLYSQRGLAFDVLSLGGDETVSERIISLGEEISLQPPPDYRIHTKKKVK